MKRILFAVLTITTVFLACNKEKSFEVNQTPSQGSLLTNGNECAPKTIGGIYKVGKVMNDSNFIEVEINVSQAGSYIIATDTINGYAFSAQGSFTSTGSNKVKLKGSGTPVAAGINTFQIVFDSSACFVQITVAPASGGGGGGASVFTLVGAGAACTDANVQGAYVASTALNATNKVVIKVNVTTIGTYGIATTTVNGMTFAGAGTFAVTGQQLVTLNGAGTPITAGTSTFTVNAGGGSCTFPVIVTATPPQPPVGNQDYFPTTQGSWWSYTMDGEPDTDTIHKKATTTAVRAGQTYRVFDLSFTSIPIDTTHYRKANNDYFHRTLVDSFTSIWLDDYQFAELNFLRENAPTGTTWQSTFSGTEGGAAVQIRYTWTVDSTNASMTVHGVAYTNMIKMKMQVHLNYGTGWEEDYLTTMYFAKGVGLVLLRLFDPFFTDEYVERLKDKRVY